MPVRLTDRIVATIAPGAKRRAIADAVVPGLRLRLTPGGVKTWGLWYRTRTGEPRNHTIGSYPALSLAAARQEARTKLAQIELGGDPHAALLLAREQAKAEASGAGPLTVERLTNRCLEKLPLRPKTSKEWRRLAAVEIIPALGNRPAAEVTRAELRTWLAGIVDRPAPHTANHAFVVLRRAYTWGIEQDLLTALPFVGLKMPAEDRRSERVLSAPEIKAVFEALDVVGHGRPLERADLPKHSRKTAPGWPVYADATRLLFYTAVRRDMVLGMRRSELEDLDGRDPRWIVPGGFTGRSKSGKAHVAPLSGPALEIIRRRLSAAKGELLFPMTRRGKLAALQGAPALDLPMTWSSHFVAELRAAANAAFGASLPRWTIHNIRHTVATHLREDLKVSREVVSLILGHTQAGPAATRIYDRSEMLPERRAALVTWAAWLQRTASGRTQKGSVLAMRGRS